MGKLIDSLELDLAIGGTVAAMNGADFLCYVTPAKYLRLPTVRDVADGVIASKVAAHAADLAKGMNYALEREEAMAHARKRLGWNGQISLSIDPEKADAFRRDSEIKDDDVWTMCGEFCAIKRLQETGYD